MVDRTRKTIRAYTGVDVDIKYGSLKDALAEIQNLIAKYGEEATIEAYTPAYSDSEYLGVYAKREETDKEMANRIASEEENEKWRAARDAEEYERLKKKFGG